MRFFSPPEKPSLTGPLEQRLVDLDELRLLLDEGQEVHGVELLLAAVLADRVQRGLEEVDVADAGDLDRVLEGQEDALPRALLGAQLQQVPALVEHLALGDLVARAAGQDVGQRALARAVGPHDRVDLAGAHVQVEALAGSRLSATLAWRFLISSIISLV